MDKDEFINRGSLQKRPPLNTKKGKCYLYKDNPLNKDTTAKFAKKYSYKKRMKSMEELNEFR